MTLPVPDELYVVFHEQWEWADLDYTNPNRKKSILPPLAFANAYEPNKKGWDKKRRTQFEWAYMRGCYEEREDGIWLGKTAEWNWETKTHIPIPERRVEEYLQPKIIKNEPLSGFKIAKSVTRYSTSNKLWRILDPRNFELEISTHNMEDILAEGTVSKNEIMGKFVWIPGRTIILQRVE